MPKVKLIEVFEDERSGYSYEGDDIEYDYTKLTNWENITSEKLEELRLAVKHYNKINKEPKLLLLVDHELTPSIQSTIDIWFLQQKIEKESREKMRTDAEKKKEERKAKLQVKREEKERKKFEELAAKFGVQNVKT